MKPRKPESPPDPGSHLDDEAAAMRAIGEAPVDVEGRLLPPPTLANVFAVEGFLRGVLALCGPRVGRLPTLVEEPWPDGVEEPDPL